LANPLASQCTARSKRTGEQCRLQVVGGGVCHIHGGAARQVKAKREQRVALAEIQAAAPAVVAQKEPEELLLDALHDVNQVLQQIKRDPSGGSVNPILLQLAGHWLDRLARIGKVVVDGDLSQKLHTRLGWLAEDRAATVTAYLAAVVEASPLTAQQKLAVWQSRFDGLQRIADRAAPSRMLNDATVRFTAELQVAARVEEFGRDAPDFDGDDEPADTDIDTWRR
jgi:hypothetical protein